MTVAAVAAAVQGLDILIPFVIKVINIVETRSGKPIAEMTVAEMEAAIDVIEIKDPQTLVAEGEAMVSPAVTQPSAVQPE